MRLFILKKGFGFFLKSRSFFSPNSIPSPLDMTCFVNAVFCKVAEVISTIPHTNITVTFCIFNFVNMEYIFVENQESNLWAIQSSKETTFVQILYTLSKKLMPIFKRHYIVHGSYLLHRNVDMHFWNTCNLSLTYFVLLLLIINQTGLPYFGWWVRQSSFLKTEASIINLVMITRRM